MGVRGTAKRRRQARYLICGLCDDVLVRILELLPDTGALSRRWRGLWTQIPGLRFASDSWPKLRTASDVKRFISFVHRALALRAAQTEPAVENLAISLKLNDHWGIETERIVKLSVRAAQRWIRHEIKSLDIDLRLPIVTSPAPAYNKMRLMTLDELPSSAKMETMRLALGSAIVQLPSSATFSSLTDLSLECIVVADANGDLLLARLLSSACCPRLQKLRLRKLEFAIAAYDPLELPLEASALLELSIEDMQDPLNLELRTPSLRGFQMERSNVEVLTISAPNLEGLVMDDQPYNIYFNDESPGVQSLEVELYSHGYSDDDEINDNSIRLLQNCTSLKCLQVSLHVPKRKDKRFDILKDRIPHLLHVTSLTVDAYFSELHSFGAVMSSLLKECSNVRHLHLHCRYFITMGNVSRLDFLCDNPGHWKSHEIPLSHLQEVELNELAGINCELWFLQFVLSNARELKKVTISFNKDYRAKDTRDASGLLSLLGCGTWTACSDTYLSYMWKRHL